MKILKEIRTFILCLICGAACSVLGTGFVAIIALLTMVFTKIPFQMNIGTRPEVFYPFSIILFLIGFYWTTKKSSKE